MRSAIYKIVMPIKLAWWIWELNIFSGDIGSALIPFKSMIIVDKNGK